MTAGLLAIHWQTQNGVEAGGRNQWDTPLPPDGEPQTYLMLFPSAVGPRECPAEEYRGRAMTRTAMIVNFLHIHVQETVIILEEGNLSHPWCPQCDILVPCKALNGWHTTTTQCAKGEESERHRLVEEEIRESAARAFQAYGRPIEMVTSFKYLGWVLMSLDDDWLEVVGNL